MKLKYSEFDIFGKRLGLFYKNKEKISSLFGLASTFVYIIVSAGIFLYYAIQTIKHKDLIVYDSTVYSKDVPSIDLNNTESLYLAFAVEEPEAPVLDMIATVSDEYPTENWIDSADTTWYTEGETSYTISTAAELAGLAKLVSDGTAFCDKNFNSVAITLDASRLVKIFVIVFFISTISIWSF